MTWKDHLKMAFMAAIAMAMLSCSFVAGYHYYYNRPIHEELVSSIDKVDNKANALNMRIDSLENSLAHMTRSAQMSDLFLAEFLNVLAQHTREQDVRLDTFQKRHLDLLRAMPFYHKESATTIDPEEKLKADEQVKEILKWNKRSDAE